MARLSYGELSDIKRKILRDLYSTNENALAERKKEIAGENRELAMKPLWSLINQLPNELFHKNATYELFINYNFKDTDKNNRLSEIWQYRGNPTQADSQINPPLDYSRPSKSRKTNLVPALQQKAAELCEDIIKLRNEKNELSKYLDTTTESYTGSLQLRKIWPSNLHKYLPAEPLPKPKKLSTNTAIKTKKGITITAPTFISQRLTSNLLEKE